MVRAVPAWYAVSACVPSLHGIHRHVRVARKGQAPRACLSLSIRSHEFRHVCLFGLTNFVRPGTLPVQNGRICTADPGCQLGNSRLTRVRKSREEDGTGKWNVAGDCQKPLVHLV